MNNADIHKGLDKANVRDYLAKQIAGNYEYYKGIIPRLEKQLATAKAFEAAMELIEQNGWQEIDVSDSVDYYQSKDYFPFVGTESECEKQGL